jgi:tagaturonate reductase
VSSHLLPESILQFGAGNFLRAFADVLVDQANRDPATAAGRIVVVQSTGRERADALNQAGGAYHVAFQGIVDGAVSDETEHISAISRALHAGTQWDDVLNFAREPQLRWILSNTTEAGFALDPKDTPRADGTPYSFPAKLLAVLLARFESGAPALSVVPCELIEANGAKLRALVLEQARLWSVSVKASAWIGESCQWIDNLVDRIVPGPPATHALKAVDPLLLSAEPYALWAVQTQAAFIEHPAVVRTDDIAPYYLRKVRILNGAHTALAAYALPRGIRTVRECVEHPDVGPWLHRVLFEEIVPVLEGRVADPAGFARVTLERFQNPFLEHELSKIALYQETKVRVRLLPTVADYETKFGKKPALLSAALGR